MRQASVPSVSSGLPIQTAPIASYQIHVPMYYDPFQYEMERIIKEDQTIKVYKDTISALFTCLLIY